MIMALKNEQYNRILREYDSRRLQNKHDLDHRISHAYSLIPELRELEEGLITLSAASGRMALRGDDNSLKNLKAALSGLQDRKVQLLLQKGLPSDYLEMHYQCNKCQDNGDKPSASSI
jgi:DNA replication protein DnaC